MQFNKNTNKVDIGFENNIECRKVIYEQGIGNGQRDIASTVLFLAMQSLKRKLRHYAEPSGSRAIALHPLYLPDRPLNHLPSVCPSIFPAFSTRATSSTNNFFFLFFSFLSLYTCRIIDFCNIYWPTKKTWVLEFCYISIHAL